MTLPEVSSKYGAPMGRVSVVGEPVKLAITRIAIDSGGYDSGGAYWGLGDPLYRVEGEATDLYRRAKSARELRVALRAEFPNVEFV